MIANHGNFRVSAFSKVTSKQIVGLSHPPSLLATKQKVLGSRRSSANASCSSTSSKEDKPMSVMIRRRAPRMSLDGGQLLEVTGVRAPQLNEYGLPTIPSSI